MHVVKPHWTVQQDMSMPRYYRYENHGPVHLFHPFAVRQDGNMFDMQDPQEVGVLLLQGRASGEGPGLLFEEML